MRRDHGTFDRRSLLRWGGCGLLGAALPTLVTSAAQAQPRTADASATAKPLAWVGGELHRPGEPPLKNSVVVVEDGKLSYIGDDRGRAASARRIDVQGRIVTAGMVDLFTNLGVVEVSLEASTRDMRAVGKDPVRAAFRTADGYNPASSLIAIAREQGLTSAGVIPNGGLVAGTSAWADLAGALPDDALATRELALHIRLNAGWHRSGDGSRGSAFLRLRELFDDARSYRGNKAGFERRQLRTLRASRLDLEVLLRALDGKLATVVHVDRASDIVNVLQLAKDNGLKLVLGSAAEGWKVAPQIAAAKVSVVVHPLHSGPSTFAALGAREDNAALLHRAGVRLALSTGDTHNVRKLRQAAGNAVRAGLPHAEALAAITQNPGTMLGLEEDYGPLKVGRIANLVLWSADPLELSSRVERMLIRGHEVSLRSRQTALLERYR